MKRIIGISLLLFTAVLFSCQKENIDAPAEEGFSEKAAQITLTEVQLESVSTEMEYEVEFYANAERFLARWWHLGKVWRWNEKLRYLENHCPDVTIDEDDENVYPKTITLDYGDSTLLRNGKVLSGQIIIEISAPRTSLDYKRMVTYNEFGIDSIEINGTSLVTVNKVDEMLRQFKSDFIITLADGSTLTRSSERTWQWIEGIDTEDDQTDDVILINGFVNAEFNGDVYKKEIVTPLKRLGDCRFIVEGIVTITLNNKLLCSIDYGDGTCDEVATVTKDGETYEIDLPNHKMKGRHEHANNQNGNSDSGNRNG
jgi:hypothetical protein